MAIFPIPTAPQSRSSASQAIKDAFELTFDTIPEHKLALISGSETDMTAKRVSVSLNRYRVRCPTCHNRFVNEKDAEFHQKGKAFTCGGHGVCLNGDEAVEHARTENHSQCFVKGCGFDGGLWGATNKVKEHMKTAHGI